MCQPVPHPTSPAVDVLLPLPAGQRKGPCCSTMGGRRRQWELVLPMGRGQRRTGQTDEAGGLDRGARFLEAAGGPASLVPTLRASSHRQCAPRHQRAEVRLGWGRARGGVSLSWVPMEEWRCWSLTATDLWASPVAHPMPIGATPTYAPSFGPWASGAAPHTLTLRGDRSWSPPLPTVLLWVPSAHPNPPDAVPRHRAGHRSLSPA